MLHHPNVIETRPTVRWENGTLTTVYVIKTDLVLAPEDPAYDEEAVNNLLKSAERYAKEHNYDAFELSGINKSRPPNPNSH